MNPPYPMNGSPYPSSPSPFHQAGGSTASPAGGQSANVTPTMPTHPAQYQYTAAVHHHSSYGHHPYPSYAQYPGMMMYPPQTGAHPESSQSVSAAPPPATGKRKRKYAHDGASSRVSDEEGADSGTDMQRVGSGSAAPVVDGKKRTKTQRACDSCRSRKIRSVPLFAVLPRPALFTPRVPCAFFPPRSFHPSLSDLGLANLGIIFIDATSCRMLIHRYASTVNSTPLNAPSSCPSPRRASESRKWRR